MIWSAVKVYSSASNLFGYYKNHDFQTCLKRGNAERTTLWHYMYDQFDPRMFIDARN